MDDTRSRLLNWRTGAIVALVFGISALLVACGGGDSSKTEQVQTAAQEKESAQATVPPAWKPRVPGPEVINGITVPREPAPSVNNATLAGVDSNKNGVRDDIERLIAREFGNSTDTYIVAFDHAKTLQTALVAPSRAAANAHARLVACKGASLLGKLKQITVATLNTNVRSRAYGSAFAGAVIPSDEECAE